MIYRLYKAFPSNVVNAAMTVNTDPCVSFLFNPDNTDYANFKREVLAGAELQDADGNVMTQEQADDFIKELP
jgi:hypothetical protein